MLNHFVDSLDAYVVEQVNHVKTGYRILHNFQFNLAMLLQTNQIHLRLVHWFVQALIRLAPDQEDISDEARYSIYSSTDSVERLIEISSELKDVMLHFTTSLVS